MVVSSSGTACCAVAGTATSAAVWRSAARITLLEADVSWLKGQVVELHREIAARDALARAHTSWDYRVYAELQRLDAKTAATVGPPPTLYPSERSA